MARSLSAADIYVINEEVMGEEPRVRDRHLLRSAAHRPFLAAFGQDAYPTLMDKAAALLHSLAYHHLFMDGNKRTATRALVLFLDANGYEGTWDDAIIQDYVLQVARGEHDVEAIAAWLEAHTTPSAR